MTTSVYLSNNKIQVAQGDRTKNGPQVSKVYEYEMPQGNLLNGMITNETALAEELTQMWDMYHLPASGVELIINGLAFSIRRLEFPTVDKKKLQNMIPLEFDAEEGASMVYDFMPYERKDANEVKQVMAVQASVSLVEQWIEIFSAMDVTLDRITPSNCTIMKYLKDQKELHQGSFLILGMDDNSLNAVLWVNGSQLFTSTKRVFSKYGSPEFGLEVTRQVSELQQSYRAQKLEAPLHQILTYGFDEDARMALIASLKEAGMDLMVNPMQGQYADELAAIGNLIYRDKDINLIEAIKRVKKAEKKMTRSYKWILPPAVLLGAGVIATAVLGGISIYRGNQINTLSDYVNNPSNQEILAQVDSMEAQINQMRNYLNEASQVQGMISSFPLMNSRVAETVYASAPVGVTPEISSYDSKTGNLLVDVQAQQVTDCNLYASALQNTGIFLSVQYNGYNFDQSRNVYRVQLNCTLNENAGK